MPLLRMTTRRWVIAVAVVGIVFSLHQWGGILDDDEPDKLSPLVRELFFWSWIGLWATLLLLCMGLAHVLRLRSAQPMRRKHEHAVRRPWPPVPPDPPVSD